MNLMTLLDAKVPLIQAPMAGGPSTPELAAAVSNAGGVGSLGVGYLAPQRMRETIAATRALTSGSFAVNLFLGPEPAVDDVAIATAERLLLPYRKELGLDPDAPTPSSFAEDIDAQLAVILDERPPIFSFTFGLPSRSFLDECRRRNIVTVGTATNLEEARMLEESGIDALCVQGIEAGGHRGTFLGADEELGLIALVPLVVANVATPVIAAGGITSGRGIAAVLALGAQAAQLGTAFLSCPEAGTGSAYRAALSAASRLASPTRMTTAFSGRRARGIVNRFMRELEPHAAALPPYPIMNALTREIRTRAALEGRSEFLSLWAGQGLRSTQTMPAAQLVEQLTNEMRAAEVTRTERRRPHANGANAAADADRPGSQG